jgi:hypothetical protein
MALLFPLLLLLTSGCGRVINRTAERKIRDALPAYIGPARVWRVRVENPELETLQGKLRHIYIEGEGVSLKQTIVCDFLQVQLRNTRVDVARERLQSIERTLFQAVVSERSLNDYLRRHKPPEDDPIRIKQVRVRQNRFTIEATRWLLGRAWPFSITVEPLLASATRLEFDPEKMAVLGLDVPLPRSVLRFFASLLNTGFDFTTLPFPVRITRFTADNGRVIVDGSADVMKSLNERIGAYLSPRSPALADSLGTFSEEEKTFYGVGVTSDD